METMTTWLDWVRANPMIGVVAAVAFIGVVWLLRRPDPVLKEGAKEFERLTEKNRGKYDDLRPLK